MRSLHREVQSYRDDNERIMKAQEEILHHLNMFHNKLSKYSGTKNEDTTRKVTTSRSHDYPSRIEAIISTYQLQGKVTMWWDQLKQANHLDEKMISWRKFKGYFQEKYLCEHYYERKMKNLFELKLQA
jgi:hypothetical protein